VVSVFGVIVVVVVVVVVVVAVVVVVVVIKLRFIYILNLNNIFGDILLILESCKKIPGLFGLNHFNKVFQANNVGESPPTLSPNFELHF